MFHRALRWDVEATGTSHLMMSVMGRWSELRSSPTVHSVPLDQALLIAVTSGVSWLPVHACDGAVIEDAVVLTEA